MATMRLFVLIWSDGSDIFFLCARVAYLGVMAATLRTVVRSYYYRRRHPCCDADPYVWLTVGGGSFLDKLRRL